MANQKDMMIFIGLFIGAVIALAFLPDIANAVTTQTTTFLNNNLSVTLPSANDTLSLQGREVVGTMIIGNSTDLIGIGETYNLNNQLVNGLLTVAITANDTSEVQGTVANATYTFRDDGFLNDSGARAVNNLVIIFSALAIFVFVVVMILKGSTGELSGLGKR